MNRDRTEQDLFQSALGCTLASPFADMLAVKTQWRKLGGVEGYHLVQSFAPGEVTPELAHQIGLELAQRLLGGEFQAVVSTHLNTRCIHNHIVWNSVSLTDGRKYRSNEKSYYTQVRRISDELCKKYVLSLIQPGRTGQPGCPYAQWQRSERANPPGKRPSSGTWTKPLTGPSPGGSFFGRWRAGVTPSGLTGSTPPSPRRDGSVRCG